MNVSKIYQLDFFLTPEESEIKALRKEVKAISDSSTKVRKGTYSKIGELNKIVNDLHERLSLLEAHICRSNLKT